MSVPGVIDSDYRGEVRVLLFNHSDTAVHFPAGSRIAQLVFCVIEKPLMEIVPELPPSARGENGFGSTTEDVAAGVP